MLTDEDIKKLLNVLATKEDVFELKQDMSGLREAVQSLTISIDKLVKAVDDMHQEFVATSAKIDRHERWIHQIAEKVGIKLED